MKQQNKNPDKLEITEETSVADVPTETDTTPSILTETEIDLDDKYHEDYPTEEVSEE